MLKTLKKVVVSTWPTFCGVCMALREFEFVEDSGNQEVYECPDCHCRKTVTVR